jgi:hypothetical protein
MLASRSSCIIDIGRTKLTRSLKKKSQRETARWQVMRSFDALTRDAQKRVSGQLVPLFKPVHWRDLSAKTLNRIALTR